MTQDNTCPNCKTDLQGEKIWDHFMQEYQDVEIADRYAAMYGADREQGHFSNIIGVYDMELDRTTQWLCPICEHIWDRV